MDGRPPIDRAALERSARLGRRAFLAGGAAAFAAAGYATGRATAPEGWPGPATGAAPPTPADAAGWAEVRAAFAAPADVVHLDAFVLGPPSAPVREAVDAHRRALDRDGHAYLEGAEASAEDAVRSAAAAYMGTDAALVALTDSTSMGIGLMYGGLRLRPGDEIAHDGPRLLRHPRGAPLRRAALGRARHPRRALRRSGRGRVAGRDGRAPHRRRHARDARRRPSPGCTPAPASSCPSARSPTRSASARGPARRRSARCSPSTACTASAPSPRRSPSWAATSSPPAGTSGCTGRAAPACCGAATPPGRGSSRSSRRSRARSTATGWRGAPRTSAHTTGARR